MRTNSRRRELIAFSSKIKETIVGSFPSVCLLNSELIALSIAGFFFGMVRTREKIISGSKPNSIDWESIFCSIANPPTCLIMIIGKNDSTGMAASDSRSPAQSLSYICMTPSINPSWTSAPQPSAMDASEKTIVPTSNSKSFNAGFFALLLISRTSLLSSETNSASSFSALIGAENLTYIAESSEPKVAVPVKRKSLPSKPR
mmetsp:Transcript_4965/g.6066  ORF Transcript_4965/g.6066 Transcript_4965/m.6066 type:complete len:202 (+) Transcript_4965:1042-1647(+)